MCAPTPSRSQPPSARFRSPRTFWQNRLLLRLSQPRLERKVCRVLIICMNITNRSQHLLSTPSPRRLQSQDSSQRVAHRSESFRRLARTQNLPADQTPAKFGTRTGLRLRHLQSNSPTRNSSNSMAFTWPRASSQTRTARSLNGRTSTRTRTTGSLTRLLGLTARSQLSRLRITSRRRKRPSLPNLAKTNRPKALSRL